MALARYVKHSTWTERVAIAGTLLFAIALAQFTVWKESELFWRDVGGYPVWLRDSVRTLYYPYLLFVLACALTISRSVLGRLLREQKVSRIWALLLFSWVILGGSVSLLLANNVINLIENRPLHYHPPAANDGGGDFPPTPTDPMAGR